MGPKRPSRPPPGRGSLAAILSEPQLGANLLLIGSAPECGLGFTFVLAPLLPPPLVAARPVICCQARSCPRGTHIRRSACLSAAKCTRRSRAGPTYPGLLP